jgi:hypothetical protein
VVGQRLRGVMMIDGGLIAGPRGRPGPLEDVRKIDGVGSGAAEVSSRALVKHRVGSRTWMKRKEMAPLRLEIQHFSFSISAAQYHFGHETQATRTSDTASLAPRSPCSA